MRGLTAWYRTENVESGTAACSAKEASVAITISGVVTKTIRYAFQCAEDGAVCIGTTIRTVLPGATRGDVIGDGGSTHLAGTTCDTLVERALGDGSGNCAA